MASYVWLWCSFGFIIALTSIYATNAHEYVHLTVAEHYGGINCSSHIDYIFGSYTHCESYAQRSNEEALAEQAAHIHNEVVSYNDKAIVMSIVGCSMVISFLLLLIYNEIRTNNEKYINQ